MRILIIFPLMFGLAMIGASQTVESPRQDTAIPGTRVSLVPPTGFTPAAQFSGFWQESIGSSIMVTEFSGPLSEVSSGFLNSSELAKRGMALLNKREVNVNNESGLMLHLRQNALGTEYRKWLLIFGDEKESVIIAATFPKELEGNLSERMKASVLTAKWDRERKVPPTEGLNFTLTEKGEIRLAKRIANSLLYTKSGVFPSKTVDDPLFIIGQALSKLDIEDKEQFAKSRLSQTATITDVEIEQFGQVTVDNLSGYEIFAKGNDKESGSSMLVYQMVLYEGQSYYIMQGLVSSKHGQTYLPAFKEMSRSFRRKK
jgi:hypothetical protein